MGSYDLEVFFFDFGTVLVNVVVGVSGSIKRKVIRFSRKVGVEWVREGLKNCGEGEGK